MSERSRWAGAVDAAGDVATALAEHATRHGHDAALRDVLPRAGRSAALARRLAAAGVDPAAVRGVADLDALPVVTKDEVRLAQAADPPFAGGLADSARVVRLFSSPGPVYEPQVAGPDPWRWGQALRALGVGEADVVLNCFGYHLTPAGAMFDEGALAVGARVVPGGIGNQDTQVQAIADLGVSAYTGLPSYLFGLIERYRSSGLPASSWRLRRALVTAEPLPDSLRRDLTDWVPDVRAAYGTAETGLLAYEPDADGGMVVGDGVVVQVCDLDTGLPRTDDREGQVVVTLLREDYPLVRFGTGDLSAWMLAPDGGLRLRGVLGRVGAAVKVRGMFLHPAQAARVLSGVDGVAEHRFVVTRSGHRDDLRCEVLPAAGAGADLVERVQRAVRDGLRFSSTVTLVERIEEGESGAVTDERSWE